MSLVIELILGVAIVSSLSLHFHSVFAFPDLIDKLILSQSDTRAARQVSWTLDSKLFAYLHERLRNDEEAFNSASLFIWI